MTVTILVVLFTCFVGIYQFYQRAKAKNPFYWTFEKGCPYCNKHREEVRKTNPDARFRPCMHCFRPSTFRDDLWTYIGRPIVFVCTAIIAMSLIMTFGYGAYMGASHLYQSVSLDNYRKRE